MGLIIASASEGLGKGDHATSMLTYCNKDGGEQTCPLFQCGRCAMVGAFLSNPCPYGSRRRHKGPTPRARTWRSWIDEQKALDPGYKLKSINTERLFEVGDYVVMAYPHLDLCDEVFASPSGFLRDGRPWIKKADFTIDVVQKLVDQLPHAVMGGEIREVQQKAVPMFLYDLSFAYPELYTELIKRQPLGVATEKDRWGISIKSHGYHHRASEVPYTERYPKIEFFVKHKGTIQINQLENGSTLAVKGFPSTLRIVDGRYYVTTLIEKCVDTPLYFWLREERQKGGRIEITVEVNPNAEFEMNDPAVIQAKFEAGAYFPNLWLYRKMEEK